MGSAVTIGSPISGRRHLPWGMSSSCRQSAPHGAHASTCQRHEPHDHAERRILHTCVLEAEKDARSSAVVVSNRRSAGKVRGRRAHASGRAAGSPYAEVELATPSRR